MSDPVLPQASLFLGIIPALFILYISLKGYDGHYKDKNIFLSFMFGIIAGFFSFLIERMTTSVYLYFIVLFPVLEQLFKTMLLNIRRLHQKKETIIYGLSLGLGFGAMFTLDALLYADFQTVDILQISLVIIGSIGIILFHGATGILIGYGVFMAELAKYVIFSIILHIPITLWFVLTGYYRVEYLQVGLIFYGFLIFWYAYIRVMRQTILEPVRKRVKKMK